MNSLFYSRSLEEERERVEVCDCQSLLFPRCPFIQQLLLLLFLLFRLSLFDQCVFDLRHRCEDGRSLTECSRVLTDKSSSKKNTPLTASSSVKTSPPSSSTCFVIIFSVFFVKKKRKQKKRRRRRKNTAGTYAQCSQLGCHFDLLSLVLTSEAFEKNKNVLARTRALTHPALCYCRVVRWLTKF